MRIAGAFLIAGLAARAALADEAGFTVLADGAAFPEGPAVIGGRLHYVEYAGGRVMVMGETGPAVLWEDPACGPSAVHPFQSDLLITCYDSGTIVRITLSGEAVATITGDREGRPLDGPNDFTSDGRGGVYFTTSGPWEAAPIVGRVYHMPLEGIPRLVADDLHYANGLALTPSGTRLVVAESEAGRLISFAVGADGALTDRRLFVRIRELDEASGGLGYPDGIEFGPDGNLYVGQYSSGRILVVNQDGGLERVIEVPSAAAPNLAFSKDGATLYVTAVDETAEAPYPGKVYSLTMD